MYFIFLAMLHSLTMCNISPLRAQGNFTSRRRVLRCSGEVSKIIRKFCPCFLWLPDSQKCRCFRIKVWATLMAFA